MSRTLTRNRLRLIAPLAALAVAVTLLGAQDAHAQQAINLTVLQSPEGGCKSVNAANIGQSWAGAASVNGYTIHPNINAVDGKLVIPRHDYTTEVDVDNAVTTRIDLPPNGIICVSSLQADTNWHTSYHFPLSFNRNAANTPVYLLVEEVADFRYGVQLKVSGGPPSTRYGIGMDRVGGMGGPGGSDGGSCDWTFSDPDRAGGGLGPGGGAGSTGGTGGEGASPVRDGEDGTTGAQGGALYSQPEHRILHGGSGGGCGTNGSSPYGGGGGGGVIVIAAGTEINLSNNSSYQTSRIWAKGGYASGYGGDGGGGVVRLISDRIYSGDSSSLADFQIDVRGGNNAESNAGLIKLESPDVSGYFLNNLYPSDGVYYGAQQDILPANVPTLEIVSVDATYDGVAKTGITRTESDPSRHIHTVPGVFLEAPSPTQTITVHLHSENVPHDATLVVRMNTVYEEPSGQGDTDWRFVYGTNITPSTTGSGPIDWTASLEVPPDMELGAIEAWVENIQ